MMLRKKYKYILLSAILVGCLFGFSYLHGMQKLIAFIVTFALTVFGTLYVQYSSVSTEKSLIHFMKKTYMLVLVLPTVLILGALLSLIYFPNLGLPLKIITISAVGSLMYIISLMSNIFLVVFEKKEAIPLYRVAITWSQILTVIIAIPFFSGLFKVPIISFYQSLIVGFISAFFAYFLMWVQEMDTDVPDIDGGEEFVNASMIGFVVFTFSISTSFLPTESFLRSLLVSSVLMSSLGYIQAHYRNSITKRLMKEYALITVLFLSFVLLFS